MKKKYAGSPPGFLIKSVGLKTLYINFVRSFIFRYTKDDDISRMKNNFQEGRRNYFRKNMLLLFFDLS